jgi:hypothetical protein
MYSKTTLLNLYSSLTNDSATPNQTLGLQLMNDSIRRICADRDWDFLQKSKTVLTVAAQQFYNLPYDYDSLITCNIMNGTTLYIPKECPSREFWDVLNQQTTFQSNFPEYFFIYNGQIGFYPTPSTGALTINLNYRRTIIDLSMADYSTGNVVAVANGGTTVTGSGTTWTAPMVGRYIKIIPTDVAATSGDGVWYEISAVGGATSLTIKKGYNGTALAATTATYIISQVPILPEAYQDTRQPWFITPPSIRT